MLKTRGSTLIVEKTTSFTLYRAHRSCAPQPVFAAPHRHRSFSRGTVLFSGGIWESYSLHHCPDNFIISAKNSTVNRKKILFFRRSLERKRGIAYCFFDRQFIEDALFMIIQLDRYILRIRRQPFYDRRL